MSSDSERPREAVQVEKWIAEAREGNQEALGKLLELCRHYLLLVANNELTPALWAKVAPSDIVQDTLMEAGCHFPQFSGSSEEELLAWLRGILRHNAADARRRFERGKRQVGREVSLEDVPPLAAPPDRGESPSKQAQTHEQDEQLEQAIRKLPQHYQQVLLLHTTENLSFAQIADKLGSSADAVRKLWGRAVEELAKHLESPQDSA